MTLHRVYGLTLDTDIPFGPLAGDHGGDVDWTIRWNDDGVDLEAEPAGGRMVDSDYWPSYRHEHEVTIWARRHGRFDIDPGRRTIAVALFERNPDVAALLLRGVVMSMILELESLPVLHANAIDVCGSAIAFTGPQGAGKTTVTTALCAAGLTLPTDDVVPVERHGGVLCSRSGLTDLRLRPAAAGLLDLFPSNGDPTFSIDGRTVLQLPPHPAERLPLHSIVVPSPSDDHTGDDRIEPIERREALAVLLGAFRVPSFTDQALAQARLAIVSAMMQELAIGRLLMPVRPEWNHDDAVGTRAAVERWHAEVGA